ncbi:MAG TPA: discoidin domain-containing protein [Kribbella sp.]|uniref:galactose-binding domain-containing protein n=1 Tax=Kribbella sp. TaxID=1871183 RepID=UPI002D771777|nr:discoidin domain-containing protein [Kribbella sp.]HET6293907.1 discoidin domain-containing protein [Kribbella sp.]
MFRKALAAATAAVFGAALLSAPAAQAGTTADSKRVVVYYQTQYLNNVYVSPKAMTDNTTGVTNVLVGAIHLDPEVVHLNDDPPEAAKFTQMWADLKAMQAKGVKVSAFVGGAAQGSFQRLDTEFDKYYPRLKNLVTTYGLDGLDLDVEENMSQAGINRLIDQLTTDFGTGFVITLAPVATALSGGGNLSGFNYETLERDRGSKIDWYNAQFYCGWGSMANTTGYDNIINRGLFTPNKVVTGVVTNSANCGGYVALPTLKNTLAALVAKYPAFGGVDGWEYFNSDPGGTAAPWQWAREMTSAMSGTTGPVNLALNKPATGSAACASTEGPAKSVNGSVSGGNSDKFCSLAASKFLQVDLGSSQALGKFEVTHAAAGGEAASFNTRAFTIQTSPNGSTWTTRATVTANTAAVTTHTVTGVTARYVRLNITTPTQTTDPAARIYELKIFA